jgi:hypothetical protein
VGGEGRVGGGREGGGEGKHERNNKGEYKMSLFLLHGFKSKLTATNNQDHVSASIQFDAAPGKKKIESASASI